MRKIIPGVAVCAVILAHRAPGTLGQIWPPEMPRLGVRLVFRETQLLGVHHRRLAIKNPQFARSLPGAAGNPATRLFPLDGARRFARDVEADAVDAFNLVA